MNNIKKQQHVRLQFLTVSFSISNAGKHDPKCEMLPHFQHKINIRAKIIKKFVLITINNIYNINTYNYLH